MISYRAKETYQEILKEYRKRIDYGSKAREERYKLYSLIFTKLASRYQNLDLQEFIDVCGMIQERLGIR